MIVHRMVRAAWSLTCLALFAGLLAKVASAQTLTELRDGVQYNATQLPAVPDDKLRLIHLQWNPLPNYVINVRLDRTPSGGSSSIASDMSSRNYYDSTWTYDTQYLYQLRGTMVGSYTDASGVTHGTETDWYGPSWKVTVRRVAASKAQTVDTRIDPRFSTYQTKDYKFASGLYRGGLFAGFNSDAANVARTYLSFSLAGPPTATDRLWPVGGVELYSTRNAKPDTPAALMARFVADDTWDPATLVWSNAPTFASSGGASISIPWTTGDPGKWVTLNILPDLENSLVSNGGDGTLSVAVLAQGESNGGTPATFPLQASSGWAYFARAGYIEPGQTDLGPHVFYAFGGLGTGVQSLDMNGNGAVQSNASFSGTVTLSSAAPAGGVTVALSSSDTAKLPVPATVTIAEGDTTATFYSTSGTISASGTVTISATLGNTVTKTVSVSP